MRRLSLGVFAASGTLLLTALNIVGSAVIGGNIEYASTISESLKPLGYSALGSLTALIFTEIGSHPETPNLGHPHSKSNYLQSAFAMILSVGLLWLIIGAFRLITSVAV